jgi:hypothetical protein
VEREFFKSMAKEFQQQRQQQGKDALDLDCPPPIPLHKGDRSVLIAAAQMQGILTEIKARIN